MIQKQIILDEQTIMNASVSELSAFIDTWEFQSLPNNIQMLLMEKYNLSCAYQLLLSDLCKLINT